MSRRSIIAIALLMLASTSGRAHDSWINHGGFKNAAGEWCCGAGAAVARRATLALPAGGRLASLFLRAQADKQLQAYSQPL